MIEKLDITVVVVARNEARNIGACMSALARQTLAPSEVILVDDGSTDETVRLAREACPHLRVIESATRSIAINRNVGWHAADTPWIAFVDADCEAPENWLETLAAAQTRTGASAVGGGNVPPADDGAHYRALGAMLNTFAGSRGSTQGSVPTEERDTDHLPGLNVMYARDALETVGGFDPRFARMGEDEDLSTRIRDLGYRMVVTPGADVVHRQRPDLKSWARNMRNYGKGRSRLLRRHPNLWSPLFLVPPLMLFVLPLYLVAIGFYALWAALRAGDIGLWPRVWALFVATHVPYAIGQIEGAFEGGPKRIGLIALKNAGNKGDEAIAACVTSRLNTAAEQTDTDLYLAGFGPSGLDVRPVPRTETARDRLILDLLSPATSARDVRPLHLLGLAWRSIVVFSRFHALVITGGQWVHDLSLGKHVVISGMFAFARVFGTRTGVFCVGVGPLKRKFSRWLVRRGFGPGALLVTRDAGSTALLHAAGRTQATTAADPALELATTEVEPMDADILISPCAWASFENIYKQNPAEIAASLENWTRLIDGLTAGGHRLAILPTMNPEDAAFAEKIVGERDIPIIDTIPLTPGQVQGHIAAASALISMRLHPVIFASNSGVPFVALNYAEKVSAFCDQAAMGERVIDLTEPNWADAALARLDAESLDAEAVRSARASALSRLDDAYDRLVAWLGLNQTAHVTAAQHHRRTA